MASKLQVQNEIEIQAAAGKVWEIITDDPTYLSVLNPGVKRVTSQESGMGAIRSCDVVMDGKTGNMEERCVEYTPLKSITWSLQQDSLGFNKMFSDVRFSFELKPEGEHSTYVVSKSFYDPKNVVSRLMNAIMMKRKLFSVQENILKNLKKAAEGS